ncbi:MAG: CopD family protein [Acetobacteraceae bacterium]
MSCRATERAPAGRRVLTIRLLIACLLLWTLRPAAASAHAALLSSDPPDGSTLAAPPTGIVLRFNEAVTLISLRLVGPDGAEVAPAGAIDLREDTVRAAYPAIDRHGAYLLSYRVTSADSHPVSGAIAFSVGQSGPPAARGEAAAMSSDWTLPSEVARWLFYAALLTAAGGALFRALVEEVGAPLCRSLALVALLAAVVGGVQVGLRGALLADLPVAGLFTALAWRTGAQTTLFTSLAVGTLGLLVCAIGLCRRGRSARVAGAIGAALAVGGFPLSGHAASADPRWLTGSAIGIHALAAAVWLGAFLPLRALLAGTERQQSGVVAVLRRFSTLAVPAVAVLVVSGMVLAAVQVVRPAALVASTYGVLLLAKLSAVVALIGLAAANRQWLTPALAASRPHATRRLRASIGAEMAVAGVILAVTAVLTLTPPPRVAPAAEETLHRVAVAAGSEVRADVDVTPGRAGWNRIVVTLQPAVSHGSHHAPPPKEVWLAMRQDAAGIAPVRRQLSPDGEGRFVYQGGELAIPGIWTLAIEVLVSDFDQVDLSADVPIR